MSEGVSSIINISLSLGSLSTYFVALLKRVFLIFESLSV